eukprot:tig00000093_g3634.t1
MPHTQQASPAAARDVEVDIHGASSCGGERPLAIITERRYVTRQRRSYEVHDIPSDCDLDSLRIRFERANVETSSQVMPVPPAPPAQRQIPTHLSRPHPPRSTSLQSIASSDADSSWSHFADTMNEPFRCLYPFVKLRAKCSENEVNAASEPVEISYETPGLNWRAEYLAVWRPESGGTLDISGWLLIENTCGVTLRDARVRVHGSPVPPGEAGEGYGYGDDAGAPAPLVAYPSIAVPHPVTLEDQTVVQLSLLRADSLPARTLFLAPCPEEGGGEEPRELEVSLALEAGTFTSDIPRARRAGRGAAHAAGQPLLLALRSGPGAAAAPRDVCVRYSEERPGGPGRLWATAQIESRLPSASVVRVERPLRPGWRVDPRGASVPPVLRREAPAGRFTALFEVTVPRRGSATLRFALLPPSLTKGEE